MARDERLDRLDGGGAARTGMADSLGEALMLICVTLLRRRRATDD